MLVTVLQYDLETGQFIAGYGDVLPDQDLIKAKARARQMWEDLESDQPKQIFIRQNCQDGKNLFYFDNFRKVYTPKAGA